MFGLFLLPNVALNIADDWLGISGRRGLIVLPPALGGLWGVDHRPPEDEPAPAPA